MIVQGARLVKNLYLTNLTIIYHYVFYVIVKKKKKSAKCPSKLPKAEAYFIYFIREHSTSHSCLLSKQ